MSDPVEPLSLIDDMPIGMYVVTADGEPLAANRALLELLGLTSLDDVRQLLSGSFPGNTPMAALTPYLQHSDRVVGAEAPWFRPDERRITLRHSVALLRDPDGRPVRYRGTLEEIPPVAGKDSDEPLLSARYQRVVDNISDAVMLDDRDGRVVYANPAFLELFGLDRSDLNDLVLEDYVAPEWRDVLRDRHERRIRGESVPSVFQYQGQKRDGTRMRLEVSVVSVVEHGRLVGTQSVIRDISEREKIQADYRRLFENDHDAILLIDPDTRRILEANPQASTIYGYELEVLRGLQLEALYEDPAIASDNLRSVSDDHPLRQLECRHLTSDGRVLHVEVNLAALNYAGRRVISSHNRDISERRRMVARSMQAQKMEALGQLAGGVAHDFNNVLTALMGYPGLIRLHLDDDHPALHYLDEIRSLAHRAAALTRQLLAFSRQQVLRPENLDPGAVILDMQGMLRRLIREDIELRIEPCEGSPSIRADVGQIEQVIMNLVVNARDAMPDGGVLTITVSRLDMTEDQPPVDGLSIGSYVCLSVRDTGTGMDESVRARLFEPFFTTKPLGRGTGLGLATVQGIVKQHRGAIRVDSEPGRGTEFRIYLPSTTQLSGSRRARTTTSPGMGRHDVSYRILVVEDDEAVRASIRAILEEAGHELVEALDGLEAQTILARPNARFDLVLSDLVMPNGGGADLAEYVDKHHPGLPVLLMSGYSSEPGTRQLLEDPAVQYLQKPFSPEAMLKRVRRLAERTGAASAADPDAPSVPRCVLLVDDSPVNRRLGQLLLERLGHEAHVARDGSDALTVMDQRNFDIVFMDCRMPVMDGFAAARAIRARLLPDSDVPIVATTGNLSPQLHERCRQAGMNDVVVKPYDGETLQNAIDRWVR